jgi:hypothetical protein
VFKHQYLRRMDEGLDQDLKPSVKQREGEYDSEFRW